jgi:hypothetical protein
MNKVDINGNTINVGDTVILTEDRVIGKTVYGRQGDAVKVLAFWEMYQGNLFCVVIKNNVKFLVSIKNIKHG